MSDSAHFCFFSPASWVWRALANIRIPPPGSCEPFRPCEIKVMSWYKHGIVLGGWFTGAKSRTDVWLELFLRFTNSIRLEDKWGSADVIQVHVVESAMLTHRFMHRKETLLTVPQLNILLLLLMMMMMMMIWWWWWWWRSRWRWRCWWWRWCQNRHSEKNYNNN